MLAWVVSPLPCRRLLVPVVDMLNYAPLQEARKMDSGSFYLEYHKVSQWANHRRREGINKGFH